MIPVAPQHFLLDQRAGWRALRLDPSVETTRRGALALRPMPSSGRPLADVCGTFGGVSNPTSVGVTASGEILVLDAGECTILRFDPCECRFIKLCGIGGKGRAPGNS